MAFSVVRVCKNVQSQVDARLREVTAGGRRMTGVDVAMEEKLSPQRAQSYTEW